MISQRYLELLDICNRMGYISFRVRDFIPIISVALSEFALDYRLKDVTLEGLVEDAVDLAWLGYNFIQRLTDKDLADIIQEAKDLHERKNKGYSGDNPDTWSNFRRCEDFGISTADGIVTRITDKYSRLNTLWGNPEYDKVGEAIEDTLMDFSAYLLILICILEERK